MPGLRMECRLVEIAILAVNGVTMTDNGHSIVCTVTSTCPVGFSNSTPPVTLTVNPNSTITTHPSDIVKCTGTSHTFTVVATGLNNTYHWKNGATDIVDTPGKFVNANTANLTILNLTTSDAGNYICYVKGTCGPELQSNPALLTVAAPIVITTQPSSIIDCAGSNVAFSTVATGTSLSYQWWFDNDGAGPNPAVSVGTGPSLPRNSTAANTGTYYCVVSSPCGATSTTNFVTLNIPATTNITAPPTGGTICAGGSFNFSVVATGDALQYEWYQGATKLIDGGVISLSLIHISEP